MSNAGDADVLAILRHTSSPFLSSAAVAGYCMSAFMPYSAFDVGLSHHFIEERLPPATKTIGRPRRSRFIDLSSCFAGVMSPSGHQYHRRRIFINSALHMLARAHSNTRKLSGGRRRQCRQKYRSGHQLLATQAIGIDTQVWACCHWYRLLLWYVAFLDAAAGISQQAARSPSMMSRIMPQHRSLSSFRAVNKVAALAHRRDSLRSREYRLIDETCQLNIVPPIIRSRGSAAHASSRWP